jgi:hypothetical protein
MSKLVSGIENILPSSLNYKQMKKSLLKGDRKTVKLFPATNTSTYGYNQNRVIRFNLPAGNFLDLKNTRVLFEAYATGDDASYIAFNNHIESVINKVQIFTGDGQSSVELLQDYNINAVGNFMYETTLNYGNTIANVQEGWSNDIFVRNQWAQQGGSLDPLNPHGYAVRLMGSGLFKSTLQYLPLKALANNGGYDRSLVVEITLEDPNRCMVNVFGTGTIVKNYELKNVFMQMELIDCPEYEKELTNKINGGQVVGIPYTSNERWTNTLEAGRSGDITFQMNSYYQLAQGFKTIVKDATSFGTNTIDFTNQFYRPLGIKYYQIQVGNKVFPTQLADINGLNSNAVQYNELMKYFNKSKDVKDGVLNSYEEQSINNAYFTLTNTSTPFTYAVQPAVPVTNKPNLAGNLVKGFTKVTNQNIKPIYKGMYRITLQMRLTELSSAGANSTDVQFNIKIINSDTNAQLGDMIHTSSLVPIMTVGTAFYTNFTLDEIVYLDGTYPISVLVTLSTITLGAGATYTLTIDECTFTAELIDNGDNDFISNSYMIGCTFKTWYDNEEYMRDQLEYFLDGMDTTQTNQIVFKMGKGEADPTALNLYHYLDYVGALVVDNKGISILK